MSTEKEIKKEFIKSFDKYDKNGDQTLDLEELTEFFKDLL
jgi:Ca2+-binding EF-hand superfamily protein